MSKLKLTALAASTIIRTVKKPTLPEAMKVVTAALRADAEYAWSWHCNIAMAMVDEGVNHTQASYGAQRFLSLLVSPGPLAHPLEALPPRLTPEPPPTPEEPPRNRMEVRLYGPNGNCKEFIGDPASAISLAFFALVGAPTKRAELLQELKRLDYAFGANEAVGAYELQEGESIPEPSPEPGA